MSRRGPDGEGMWISPDRQVGLAHRRLAIIDLSPAGAQPMSLPGERTVITFNGEIYNHRELRAELEAVGVRFRSQSDTEVLLHLYRRVGDDMCSKLRGMFAFAIWDADRRGLYLARDPLGIKPLYIAREADRFLFASQIKALLESGLVSRSPDPTGHVSFFLWGHCTDGHTLYSSISDVPAGGSVWVGADGCFKPAKYFDLSAAIRAGECRPDGPADLREALIDSVRSHFVSDVPVSVFLSAGRDSATIFNLASEVSKGETQALTLAFSEFQGTPNDEAPLAQKVAERLGARHSVRRISGEVFKDDLPKILDAMDSPSIDGVNTYYVSKAAAELGIKVALSGIGGDELFGGYPSFRQVPWLSRRLRVLNSRPAIGKAIRKATSGWIGNLTSPKYAGVFEYGGSLPGAYMLRRSLFMPWELKNVLDADLLEQGWKDLNPVGAMHRIIDPLSTDFERVMALEMSFYMRDRLLRDSDWASMAHSVELRTPLVDDQVLRWVAGSRRSSHPLAKEDLVRTVDGSLPKEVLDRPKTGFQVPVSEWLLGTKPGSRRDSSYREWAKVVYQSFSWM